MRIAFLHPDLGIGGAERLVVDAALAMQNSGHEVTVFTSHHDRSHCFEETRDGTLQVVVLGDSFFPRTILGKGTILMAILRQLHLVQALKNRNLFFDVYVLDQLSAAVPFLRIGTPKSRIVFYCHFPDMLLAQRKSLVKKLYRLPFDTLERWSTLLADEVAVNSNFTRKIFHDTFRTDREPAVIYPIVDLKYQAARDLQAERQLRTWPKVPLLISINRFERKKNIDLALESYSLLLHSTPEARNSLLVIAGGYDERVPENIEYLGELRALAAKYRLPSTIIFPTDDLKLERSAKVVFMPSVSSGVRDLLLSRARLLLYTPTNEHFGIVPLEAMRARIPVLATNTGGPLETVADGETGFLRKADMDEWHRVLGWAVLKATDKDIAAMGEKGYKRVEEKFSRANLQEQLGAVIERAMTAPREDEMQVAGQIKLLQSMLLVFTFVAVFAAFRLYRLIRFLVPQLIESTQW